MRLAAVLLTWLVALPACADVSLRIDPGQALAILDAMSRKDAAAADDIAAMHGTRELVAHHAPFSDQVTLEHFRASLGDALAGKPRSDLWGFDRLVENAAAVRASVAQIAGDPAAFGKALEAIIAPYTPAGLELSIDVGLVIGTPGAGWTDRPGEFFFDVGRPAGDLEGIKVVCAHELYHLVMARLQAAPKLAEDDALGRLERVLLGAIDEGMASHVARFTRGETGATSRAGLRYERLNADRMRENFRLVDAMILAMLRSGAVTADDVDRIAFGGAFDEPGYYVFREMAAGIEAARGRETLVRLAGGSPAAFVLAYHDSAPAEALRLHEETLAQVRALEAQSAP